MTAPKEWTSKEEPFLQDAEQRKKIMEYARLAGKGSKEPFFLKDSQESFLKDAEKGTESRASKIERPGKGTFVSSVFLLFNSAVGAGLLALPYCFLVAGVVPTTIAILFFAFLTGTSSTAIVAAQEASKSSDYQTIVKQRLGPKASYVMSAILATYCLLNSVGALVIVADNVGPVLVHFVGQQDAWWMQRETYVLGGGLLAFPLMCFRDITSLRFTAFVALAAMTFVVCCVVQQVLSHPASEEEALYGPVEFFVPSWSMFLALPSTCLAFQNQMQVPAIYTELRPDIKNVRTMSWIVFASKCIIVPMYLATAFAGYYMFRSQTPADILAAAYAQSATCIFVARLAVALVAILRIPINHHTARSASYTLWESLSQGQHGQPSASSSKPTELPFSFFWIEVVVYSLIMCLLATLLTSLDVVLDIMSATCAMAVMFFMPALFLLKGSSSKGYSEFSRGWLVVARAFIVIGAALAVVSIGDVIKSLS